MKYFFKILAILIFLILSISNSYSSKNTILFKINNEIITSVDILNEVKYLEIINSDFSNLNKQEAFEIAKKSLIREKIKQVELKRLLKNLNINESILNQFILNYFGKFKITSINDFDNFFSNKLIDPNTVREKITSEILWNRLVYEKYISSVKINPNKIKIELEKNNKEREFDLEEIVFSLDKNENFLDKLKIIENEIKEKNFSQTALNFSISSTSNQGGKLGWIKENFLSKKIRDEINQTKIGNHTKPIVIPGGFLILNLKNIRLVNKKVDLDEQLKVVIDKKTNEQLNQYSNIYFNKLKQNISINEL